MALLRQAVKRIVMRALNRYDKRDATAMRLEPSEWGLDVDASGTLMWDGCSMAELAREFGTPLYVVSRKRLERAYREFYNAFASRYSHVEVAYSYKTNPLPEVIRTLHEFGAAAEVISELELWLALRLGVPASRIIFNGPAKTPTALDLAVRSGIKLINIDGPAEIEQIDALARRYGHRQRVGVRLTTSVGWSSQFGFGLSNGAALDAFRAIRDSSHLVPCGLHLHLGTGIRAVSLYLEAIGELLSFARRLRAELGIEIEHVDIGGGFGVPTVRPFSGFDMRLLANGFPIKPPDPLCAPTASEYASGIAELLGRYYDLRSDKVPELILEPGRAITSAAQCLLVKVIGLKPGDRHGRFAILDGGKNITMPMGYEYHEAFVATRANERPTTRYTAFGPLCFPEDVLFRHRDMPSLQVGDILVLMDAGAYFVPNQMNFSNPRPSAVLVADGRPQLIRERESFEAVVRLDKVSSPLAPHQAIDCQG